MRSVPALSSPSISRPALVSHRRPSLRPSRRPQRTTKSIGMTSGRLLRRLRRWIESKPRPKGETSRCLRAGSWPRPGRAASRWGGPGRPRRCGGLGGGAPTATRRLRVIWSSTPGALVHHPDLRAGCGHRQPPTGRPANTRHFRHRAWPEAGAGDGARRCEVTHLQHQSPPSSPQPGPSDPRTESVTARREQWCTTGAAQPLGPDLGPKRRMGLTAGFSGVCACFSVL